MRSRLHRQKKNRLGTSQDMRGNGPYPPIAVAPARKASRRKWLGLVLLGALAGIGTWALFEFVLWSQVPPELVGKWVVTDGPDQGGTVDFYRNGTMTAKVNMGGMEGVIEASIRVEGDKIYVMTRHRKTGERGTRVQTIKVLEQNHLVLQDERGMSVRLERAR